jgi:hypothetical protein
MKSFVFLSVLWWFSFVVEGFEIRIQCTGNRPVDQGSA